MQSTDLRAKLTLKAGSSYKLPFSGPGAPLLHTNGIIFPFTPNITISHTTEYSTYDSVHTNYQQNAYAKTVNPGFQLSCSFASQTMEEAKYTVAAMHFLRVVSKMEWGADKNAGTPPPVLRFSAYGTYTQVPVVVAGFNFTYDDNVDYIKVDTGGLVHQIPVLSNMFIDILPHYSPAMQNTFTLQDFANGNGYKQGFI